MFSYKNQIVNLV